MEKGLLHKQIRDFFVRNFDVRQEKEDELETIESIRKGIEFKGTNLWVLIFATFVASLGLNTNSTAVIIGAMLISPLMGPIMGFGLGLGISDFDLIKRSFRNFATATVFSVITSTLFFLISPISEAQSELLARTQPTVYDVLIAFFGGLAGIVASSTKSKGNVIPGVAIATALMPPLCTAGFGLASGNLYYFFGAFYLYFINTVFISLATYVVVRLLKYPKKVFLNKQREKIVTRYVGVIVFFTIVPSLFLSYNLIRASYFNDRVRTFVADELSFPNTQILSKTVTDTSDKKEVKVVLIGETVPETMIANARAKMPKYGLKNVGLVVQQGFGQEATDINELKSLLMQDLYNPIWGPAGASCRTTCGWTRRCRTAPSPAIRSFWRPSSMPDGTMPPCICWPTSPISPPTGASTIPWPSVRWPRSRAWRRSTSTSSSTAAPPNPAPPPRCWRSWTAAWTRSGWGGSWTALAGAWSWTGTRITTR